MSKLNQIQNALKEIDQAKFQKLCDTYLYALGYQNITPFGVSLGKNKTKAGTPDSYILMKSGDYVFIEYSTQSSGLARKFSGDLSNCFDVNHTGISVEKIQKIILCYNSVLSPAGIDSLAQICMENKSDFENIHIGRLAHDLLSRFPHIAKEFLAIEVDSGQILPPANFIKEHQKSSFATPLDNKFYFRQEEMTAIVEYLDEGDLAIISGKPGAGKTKFALEVTNRFCEQHDDFLPYCIFDKSLTLYEDLKAYFSDVKKYLIIVDDGNRLSDFEHVLSLLRSDITDNQIKIIVTVRDYALDQILHATREYEEKKWIKLRKFKDDEIRELLRSEDFRITNSTYLDRICYIAQGNPRLAIMAGKVAVKTNDIGSLHDVTKIYDEYFSTIIDDLNELENAILLKTLGLISFFRAIDRENTNLMNKIYEAFGISESEFWDNVTQLHNLEVVDLYEHQIVKETDQIFSAYFFYRTFIKDEILSFSNLLEHFFNNFRLKIQDSIIPTVNTFGHDLVTQKLQKHFNYYWGILENDELSLVDFLDLFWFINPTKNLNYLQEKIAALPSKDTSALKFDCSVSDISDPYLKVLSKFTHAGPDNFKISLEIVFEYLFKAPDLFPQILSYIKKELVFKPNSHIYGYSLQEVLFEYLLNHTVDTQRGYVFQHIILNVANNFLRIQYDASWMENKDTVAWQRFNLTLTPELQGLRQRIWGFLFDAFEDGKNKNEVLAIIDKYIGSIQYEPEMHLCEYDASFLLPFISHCLDKESYAHCLIAQRYLGTLERMSISHADISILKSQFTNKTYVISKIFDWDYFTDHEDLSVQEYDDFKEKQLADYCSKYGFNEYLALFSHLEIILQTTEKNERYRFEKSITQILTDVLDQDFDLFMQLAEYIWSTDNNSITPYDKQIIAAFFDKYPASHLRFYRLIHSHSFQSKANWLLSFHELIPKQLIDDYYLKELYTFCDNSNAISIIWSFDFLVKYQTIDDDVIIKVISKIWDLVNDQKEKVRFDFLFNPHSKLSQNLRETFKNNHTLLKNIYLHQDALNRNMDFNGNAFKQILELDEDFIVEYIESRYARDEYFSMHDEHRDYGFIWEMWNYESIIGKTINNLSDKCTYHGSDYLNVFFKSKKEADVRPIIVEFFKKYVESNASDIDSLNMIFDVITESFPAQRKLMIGHLLKKNAAFAIFEKLYLEKSTFSGGRSFVPEYERRIIFWESLKAFFTGASFLKHKLYVENRVDQYKKMIEEENKQLFMDGW